MNPRTSTTMRRLGQRGLVVACLVTPMLSVGCRSGKPGWNMFGRRGEPSAEMLAGSGPTLTYPTPPSSKATPEAIASIAGGTSLPNTPTSPNRGMPTTTPPGMSTPGMSTPGMSTPGGSNPYALAGNQTAPPAYAMPGSKPAASPPNYAAAAANGYAASGTPVTPGSLASTPSMQTQSPSPQTQLPSGYQLGNVPASMSNQVQQGKNSFASAQTSMTNQVNAKASDVEDKVNSFALPAMNSLTPSRLASGQSTPMMPPPGMTSPANSASSAASSPASSPSSYGNGGGFTLPTGIAAGIAAVPPQPASTSNSFAPPATGISSGTAIAALGNPPSSNPASNSSTAGLSTPLPAPTNSVPSMQTATAPTSRTNPSSSSSMMGLPGSASNSPGSVRPTGYTPGSTGASNGYPGAPSVIR